MFHNKVFTFTLLLTACSAVICASQHDISLAGVEPAVKDGANVSPVVEPTTEGEDVDKRKTTTTTTSTSTTTTSTSTTTTTTKKPDTSTSTTTTTTTAAPITTTTPKPGPVPKPEIGLWNSSCILVQMGVQLNFTYEKKDNTTTHALYNIPKTAVVGDSQCNLNTTQTIQINWGPKEAVHAMILQFGLKDKTTQLTMMMFNLHLTPEDFPDAKENQSIQLIHRGKDFNAPLKMSYHCTRAQVFNLTETVDATTVNGTVTVHDVRTESFHVGKDTAFSAARDCDASNTPDIVPIAVGIALAALILIVLVSYLCARRRSTSRGYMSF